MTKTVSSKSQGGGLLTLTETGVERRRVDAKKALELRDELRSKLLEEGAEEARGRWPGSATDMM